MSNYKYAIKKLPIKSWIKYWLWRNRTGGTKYKFALSDIKEGSNFYLENTIKRKFNIFEVYGKTTQNGTPTPENPIPIINLTGNINEKIQNANLFDKTKSTDGYINYNNGSFTSSPQYTASDYILVEEGQQYYSNYATFSSSSYGLAFYDKNKEYISGRQLINLITVPDNAKYIRFCVRNSNYATGVSITDIDTLYLVKGNLATSYIPHAEQNISFPLSEGQVLAEGDYLADDGIHHVRGQVKLNGTEIWTLNANLSNNLKTITTILSDSITVANTDTTNRILATMLKGYSANELINNPVANGVALISNNRFYAVIDSSIYPDIASWKTFLSNNNMPIEYDLAEEYVEPFTEEQAEAYNKIKELYTYNEITNIDGNANLKIKYWERVER